jgi:acyl dehydratase
MPERSLTELRAMVGESRVTVETFAVEAGKVEEFARAIRDDDPVHRSEEAADDRGFDAVPAPLTFARVSDFPRYCPPGLADENRRGFDLGFDRRHTVHGEQEYVYERPLAVGDVLTGTKTLTDVYQKEGGRGGTMTFAELETEYRTQDGELVLTERKTRIETSGIDDGEGDDS